MKTPSLKSRHIKRQWYLIDAATAPVGRLSTITATLLLGKHKPSLTPHMDGGDYVIVINSDKLVITGNKGSSKLYSRHSGYPGGLRQKLLKDLVTENSTDIIRHAVRGMLPDNKLRKNRLNRLKIYSGSQHPHEGQSPEVISIGEVNGEKL